MAEHSCTLFGEGYPHPHQGATDIGLDRIFGRGIDFPHISGSGASVGPAQLAGPTDMASLDQKAGQARCRWYLGVGGVGPVLADL